MGPIVHMHDLDGPGAAATGPRHHYMFEIYALDIVIDVTPSADPFETRTSVMRAIQGHVLGARPG